MTDFKSLLENKPLLECKKEIEDQFSSVMHHANEMKLAIIASF